MAKNKMQNGIYGRALKYLPYAQAVVIDLADGSQKLVSYRTDVALIKPNGDIECYGLFSNTTRKHISAFARENGFTYYDFKNAYLSEKNIIIKAD